MGADFDAAVEIARRNVDGSERDGLEEQVAAARSWQGMAQSELERRATKGAALDLPAIRVRKNAFDRYRKANASFQATVSAARVSDNDKAELISVAMILASASLRRGRLFRDRAPGRLSAPDAHPRPRLS